MRREIPREGKNAVFSLAPIAAAMFLLAAQAAAFTGNPAGSTAQFLRIGPGARAAGMGEAYGPVAEGADAVYWNPAGLAGISRPELAYSHIELLRFFHHDYLAYAHPVPFLHGAIGAGLTMFYQDSLDLLSNTNQNLGKYGAHSEAFSLAYARSFGVGEDYREGDKAYFQDNWNIAGDYRPLDRRGDLWTGALDMGLALKAVQESVYDKRASAFAADGGVLFKHQDYEDLSLSFAFRNLGTKARFINTYESLPAEISLGAAHDRQWENRRLLCALEAAFPYYGDPYGKLGFEYSLRVGEESTASLRAGYKTLSAPGLGALTGITAGVGLRTGSLSLDFSFQPMAELGEVYRAGLGWRFGSLK